MGASMVLNIVWCCPASLPWEGHHHPWSGVLLLFLLHPLQAKQKQRPRLAEHRVPEWVRNNLQCELKAFYQTSVIFNSSLILSSCYSYIGRRGGKQVVSLARSGCLYHGTVQHELLHALGFNHEQTRSDRDNHIKVLLQNVQSGNGAVYYPKWYIREGTQYTADKNIQIALFSLSMHDFLFISWLNSVNKCTDNTL